MRFRTLLVALLLAAGGAPGQAQVAPPAAAGAGLPLPPLVPLTPVQAQLNQTYRALSSAPNTTAATAARAAYAEAMSRYAEGDRAGAAADAAWAQAQLPRSPAAVPRVAPLLPGSAGPPAAGVPAQPAQLGTGAVIPDYIRRARDAVLDARFPDDGSRSKAFAALRNAVDAWLDGDAANSRKEASHAETLAAQQR
jgi:hypothetical protein